MPSRSSSRTSRSELLGQLARFPAGRFDDGVDVCSLLGRGLEMLPAALPPTSARRAQYTAVYDPFAECWQSISGAERYAYEYDPYSTARPRFSAEQRADALTLDEALRRRAQEGRS